MGGWEAECAGGLAMERALVSVIPFSTSVGRQPKATVASNASLNVCVVVQYIGTVVEYGAVLTAHGVTMCSVCRDGLAWLELAWIG